MVRSHLQLGEYRWGQHKRGPLPVGLPRLVILGPVTDDPAPRIVPDQSAAQAQLPQGALPDGAVGEGQGSRGSKLSDGEHAT